MYENMLLHEDEDSASTQCKYSERHQQSWALKAVVAPKKRKKRKEKK
jgi:hypothetical protein